MQLPSLRTPNGSDYRIIWCQQEIRGHFYQISGRRFFISLFPEPKLIELGENDRPDVLQPSNTSCIETE